MGGELRPEASDQEPGAPARSLSQITSLAFFAADHVAEEKGKLYVNGGFFHMIQVPSYPMVLSTLGVGCSLHVPWHSYLENHRLLITMVDSDNKEMPFKVEGEFRVGADIRLRHGDPTVFNVGVTVSNVVMERPGDYRLIVSVDGRKLDDWRIQAVQTVQASPGGSAGSAPASPPHSPQG